MDLLIFKNTIMIILILRVLVGFVHKIKSEMGISNAL